MLQAVATRVPRGPIQDVDGALVRGLRLTLGLSLMDFGGRLGKEKATIQRWERAYVDEITWIGMLGKLGMPIDWKPDPEMLIKAKIEVRALRDADAEKKAKKDPAEKPPPKKKARG